MPGPRSLADRLPFLTRGARPREEAPAASSAATPAPPTPPEARPDLPDASRRSAATSSAHQAPRSGLARLLSAPRTPAAQATLPAGDAPDRTGAPPRSTLRAVAARAGQLLDTRKVLHEPAVRYEGDWRNDVAARICDDWGIDRAQHAASAVSVPALARMKALEFERKQGDRLPAGERLLGAGSGKEIAKAVGTSMISSAWQASAQVPLNTSRRGLQGAAAIAPAVREKLIAAARGELPQPSTPAAGGADAAATAPQAPGTPATEPAVPQIVIEPRAN